MEIEIYKYPRTHHIEGSRCQPGDEDLNSIPFSNIANRFVVIEEKVDGANCGISFSSSGEMLLQSRGHFLTGGAREKHFNLFKTWANAHLKELGEILSDRYIMYGEWLYAKHTVFYNYLPHYFMEFDIYDRIHGYFLDTENRRRLLANHSFVNSVLVLYEGKLKKYNDLTGHLGKSNFITESHTNDLIDSCTNRNLNYELVLKETDNSDLMEGLYIKVEEGGKVMERYKFVRPSFLTNVVNSESHWLDRPIIPNMLKPGTDIFRIEGGESRE